MGGPVVPLKRPALRYHGGKWRLAPWIVGHFPPHRIYVEPYGGAASVLLRKPRSYGEVYNDLEDEVVGLFRVLRDPEAAERLCRHLVATPYSRVEFESAYDPCDDPVERARRLVARSFMGFGSDGALRRGMTGFRANANRSGTTPAMDWRGLPDGLQQVAERFRGVVIEHRDAVEVMLQHDEASTLHYCDPPYVHATRTSKTNNGTSSCHGYRHEMTDADHRALAAVLHQLAGMVVLSGYRSPLYEALFADWPSVERETHADGAVPRTEILWFNPQAWAATQAQRQATLFDESGFANGSEA